MAAEKANFSIRFMAQHLHVSASGYYAWARASRPRRAQVDRRLGVKIAAIHRASQGRYGSPRIHAALRAAGDRVSRKRVVRLMREQQLRGRTPRRFRCTTAVDPTAPPAPNTLAQGFTVARPNRVWASDITALPTREGWLYLAVVLDLCSRRIVGWAMRPTLETELATAALHLALSRRHRRGPLLHHSDRGCQYTSAAYQALLQRAGLRCSMSGTGNCFDNAVVESFFHTLKTEIADRCYWLTRRAAITAVADYIEAFYNRTRLHSTLGYLSPATFEARFKAAA